MNHPFKHVKEVDVRDTSLAVVEHGRGEPLVLVHGAGPSDMRTWAPQIEPLAAHYDVFAYSRRGHYPNPWIDDGVAIDTAGVDVADLAALLDTLNLESAHLIGHSYGADVVLRLAIEYPQKVRSLVVEEPGLIMWLLDLPEGETLFERSLSRVRPAVYALQEGDAEKAVRLFIAAVTGGEAREELPPALKQRLLDNVPALAAHPTTPDGFDTGVTREDAAAIAVPTLLLTGEQSPAMYLLVARELALINRRIEQVQISGAAHLLHGMNPRAYNAAVLAFLAQQVAESA